MNEQKQAEACARIEGWYESPESVTGPLGTMVVDTWHKPDGSNGVGLMPKYATHDDLQRLIDGLDASEYNSFVDELFPMIPVMRGIMQATPAQKREAILKAKGLWEDGE